MVGTLGLTNTFHFEVQKEARCDGVISNRALVMSGIYAKNMFELQHEHTLKLSSPMAIGVSNALQRFCAAQQPLENFTVLVENGEEKKVVLVSFVAKRKPEMSRA